VTAALPQPRLSVILTTADRPQALACVLEGYLAQTFNDFEIVVGDDGSDHRTAAVIERYAARMPGRVVHVWQKRQGHGRARAINAATRASKGAYLVHTDGDCVPEPDFLAAHMALRRPGMFFNGRRLMMGQEWEHLTPEQVAAGEHRGADVAKSRADIARFRRRSLYYRAVNVASFDRMWARLRLMGANLGMWRADFDAANGFDETYAGWGATDEDFRRRLRDLGLRWGDAMAAANVWHIPHPPTASKPTKVKLGRNAARYDARFWFTRPVAGARHRAAEELRLSLAGAAERAEGEVVATSARAVRLPPDAEIVLIGPNGATSRPRLVDAEFLPFQVVRRAQTRIAVVLPQTPIDLLDRQLARWNGVRAVIAPESIVHGAGAILARYPVVSAVGNRAIPSAGEDDSASCYFHRNRAALAELTLQAMTSDAAIQHRRREEPAPAPAGEGMRTA
jgi:glycosyltransferase involved in cell wall biosynthesis